MKTKLLKKVRKRYKIVYYEKQVTLWDKTYKGECMVLFDKGGERYSVGVEICNPENHKKFFTSREPTKDDAKNFLLGGLINWIKEDYKQHRTRKAKQIIETIWYAK